jgi:hypothetical protein
MTCFSCTRPVVTLRIVFSLVLAAMLFVTTRASLDYSIMEVGARIGADTWFQATLADAYFGFLTFFCWVVYLERTCLRRLAWLIAILLLGNIAMAGYLLIRLFRLPADAPPADILLRREDTPHGR